MSELVNIKSIIKDGIQFLFDKYLNIIVIYARFFYLPIFLWLSIPLLAIFYVALKNPELISCIKNFFLLEISPDNKILMLQQLNVTQTDLLIFSGAMLYLSLFFIPIYIYYDSKFCVQFYKFLDSGTFPNKLDEQLKKAVKKTIKIFNFDIAIKIMLYALIPMVLFLSGIDILYIIPFFMLATFFSVKAYIEAYVMAGEYSINSNLTVRFSDISKILDYKDYLVIFVIQIINFSLYYGIASLMEFSLVELGIEIVPFVIDFSLRFLFIPAFYLMEYYCYRMIKSKQ